MLPWWWSLIFALAAILGLCGGLMAVGWRVYVWLCGVTVIGPKGQRKASSGRPK